MIDIRSKISLRSSISFHILKQRLPSFSFGVLAGWWSESIIKRTYVIDFYIQKLATTFQIMAKLNLIDRDMNMAKVYGIDYESVMTRGS